MPAGSISFRKSRRSTAVSYTHLDEIELKDDEDDYIPGMRDEMSYKSDDDEITGSGFTIEDVPVEEDDSLSAFGDAGDDDYTDDSDKEEE